MKRLAAGTGATALTWTALQFHASGPTDRIDTVLLATIGVTFSGVALVMVTGTRHWSTRAVGAFLGVLGVAITFGTTAWVREFGPYLIVHRSDGRTYHAGVPPEPMIDLARACLVVGGPLLLWGVIAWWRQRWTSHDDAAVVVTELPTLISETE